MAPTKASAVNDVQKIVERSRGIAAVSAAFSTINNHNVYVNKLDAFAKTIDADYYECASEDHQRFMKRNAEWVMKDPIVKASLTQSCSTSAELCQL